MIANKYRLIQKISEGCFGKVFKGINIRTNELVAIKIESNNNNIKTLKFEARIYQYLGALEGFSKLKWFGTDKNKCINYLVMDLLDTSILNIVKKNKLSLSVFIHIGIQMIKRINVLHDKLLLHRDIKPENFLLGKNNQTNNQIYLIDFGFCKRYEIHGEHIKEKKISNIIGTLNYVSLNVHKRLEPSRRDDLESYIYVLLFIYFGKLEWSDILQEDNIIKKKEEILYDKNINIPFFIKNMIKYVQNLKFDEKPNYEYLISLLQTCNKI